jgi:hypothetical protein
VLLESDSGAFGGIIAAEFDDDVSNNNDDDDNLDHDAEPNSIYHMYQLSSSKNNNNGSSSIIAGGVSGYGRGIDALAGVVYEGEWLNGLPHGQGLFTKTKPAARISVILSHIKLANMLCVQQNAGVVDDDEEDVNGAGVNKENWSDVVDHSFIEWTYKGEFKQGKFSGVGIFERRSLSSMKKSLSVDLFPLPALLQSSTSSSSTTSSATVAAALAATTSHSSLSSQNITNDNKQALLVSLMPKEDSLSLPWAKGVKLITSLSEEDETSAPDRTVYDVIWHSMNISLSNTNWIKYSGEFQNGEICGTGSATYIDGSEYSGQWKPLSDRSLSTTLGAEASSSSSSMSASGGNTSSSSKRVLLGTHALHRVTVGGGLTSLPDGMGSYKSCDGSYTFHGPWSYGVPHGVGEFTFRYTVMVSGGGLVRRREEREGKWVKGAPTNGDWRFCFFDEVVNSDKGMKDENDDKDEVAEKMVAATLMNRRGQYVGDVRDGFPHGKGICKYPSGSFYSGGWKKGLRDGSEGSFVWNNGSNEFCGEWRDDEVYVEGKGTLRLSDDTVVTYE